MRPVSFTLHVSAVISRCLGLAVVEATDNSKTTGIANGAGELSISDPLHATLDDGNYAYRVSILPHVMRAMTDS